MMRSFTFVVAAASVAAALTTHAKNTTTSGDHVDFFLDDSIDGKGLYAVSVIEACNPTETVYALQCTAVADDSSYVDSAICGSDASVRNRLTRGNKDTKSCP